MKRRIHATLIAASLAAAALGAATTAQAQGRAQVWVNPGPQDVAPAPVYVQPAPQYAQNWGHGEWGEPHEGEPWRRGCHAPRWNPDTRYLPGQTVWRHGHLYVARGISGRVYNVNSPPEWTPNYWAAARCG